MEEVKQYLAQEERDYQEGILLLGRFHKNRNLVNALARKESSTNREKLEYELEKIVSSPAQRATAVKAKAKAKAKEKPEQKEPASTAVNSSPKVEPTKEAEEKYQELLTNQTSIYNQRVQLSNTLADQETDEQRKAVVDQIEALQTEYNALAVKRKFYEEHGKFPEEPTKTEQSDDAPVVDKAELLKTRNNLRSQVSKAKKALDKKPEDVKKQEKLAKLQIELDQVELQLKHLADQDKKAAAEQADV